MPRIPTSGQPSLTQSPFAALNGTGLPAQPAQKPEAVPANPPASAPEKNSRKNPGKNRGRVDIIRNTAHRGGKTVTVISGFLGISLAEKEKLAREMQKSCGTGGTVKEGRIEIQGDKRAEVAHILTQAGFRAVFAGG